MKGLTQFLEHVVGDVDDVVDRPLADRLQTALQPLGRRADADVANDATDVARTALWILDIDGYGGGRGLPGFGHGARGHAEFGAGESSHLPGDAPETEAVGTVGGHLEVEHDVVEAGVDRKRSSRCE